MTQAMKCQHDGEKITGWDEVTCRKCGWIVPSGQSMGIHGGWFPSHDSHKEYKKYRTYTGMNEVYPIDATTPQQPQSVADALEEAAKIADEVLGVNNISQRIRDLIKRNAQKDGE